ncbi:NAD(P)/FAD-dependent oxidoreductase [Thalassobacillus sp. CUG 92003]|uniref:NAD(P)/FAD-dependent oxidoreductase n=1 Tax=Thalassobacillus sp. CUG 92003 TaxID=2736641 RepID=UPI0015E6A941|nr:FAD-dependent oxidoreductase [Thalassobacillus sp. CUG 92003]
MTKRVLLVGGGHAHLQVIKSYYEEREDQLQICLISSSRYQYYSGMFSGYTEGLYNLDDIRIDLKDFCEKANTNFIEKNASCVHPDQQKLICEDGSVYPFDLISFDIGSVNVPPKRHGTPADKAIKPNHNFADQIETLREQRQPLIVGGGATGAELALSIQAWKRRNGRKGNVRLVSSEGLLPDEPKHTSAKLLKMMRKYGIEVWNGERVESVYEDHVITNNRNKIRHTEVLWLGGAIAPPLFYESGLPTDAEGFALVENTLQLKGHEHVFAAGDCATMEEYPDLSKSGVYAVKQGLVLWQNIKHAVHKETLEVYQPQKKALYILSTGYQRGFMIYGALCYHSKQAWKLKNKIDREFMNRFKVE